MGPARCLVVDDDPQVLEGIVKSLRRSGYHAVGTTRAQDAIWLRGPFDVLLIDVRLPNGSVEDISRAFPGVPVLTMSGYPGAQLQKPFTREQLLAAVSGVVRSRKEARMARASLSQTLKNLPALQARAIIPPHKRKSQVLRTLFGGVVFVGGFLVPKYLGFPWQVGAFVAGLGAFTASQQLVTDYAKAIPQLARAILGAFKGGTAP